MDLFAIFFIVQTSSVLVPVAICTSSHILELKDVILASVRAPKISYCFNKASFFGRFPALGTAKTDLAVLAHILDLYTHPCALLSSLKCRAHSAAEVGEADRVLQLLLTHVSGLKLADELERPTQALYRLAVKHRTALGVGLGGVVPLEGVIAVCGEVCRDVNRKCIHVFALLFACAS
jgi:hypothetical protein